MTILKRYRHVAAIIRPLAWIYLRIRIWRKKEDASRFKEKMGYPSHPRADRPHIWIHAVSIGETISAVALVSLIARLRPDIRILLTTTSRTSQHTAAHRLGDKVIHQYAPLDVPLWVTRFLDHWRPQAVLWMESELWPVSLSLIKERHLPFFLLNARISNRALRQWRKIPTLARNLLDCFTLCIAQSEREEKHLRLLGAKRTIEAGNMKFMARPPPYDRDRYHAHRAAIKGRPVLAAISTHDREEAIIIDSTANLRRQHHLFTIIMPRHIHRCAAITADLRRRGLDVVRHSHKPDITATTDVYLIDTIGDSGLACALADIAFVGGSIARHGGQNPLEPLHYNCPVLHGPHVFKFHTMYQELDQAGATIAIDDGDDLARRLARLLTDRHYYRQAGAKGKAFLQRGKTIMDRYRELLLPTLRAIEWPDRRTLPKNKKDKGIAAPASKSAPTATRKQRQRRKIARPNRRPSM